MTLLVDYQASKPPASATPQQLHVYISHRNARQKKKVHVRRGGESKLHMVTSHDVDADPNENRTFLDFG